MSDRDGIHHVIKGTRYNGLATSYCGRNLNSFDFILTPEHAKACIEKETYVQPCKRCMKALLKQEGDI